MSDGTSEITVPIRAAQQRTLLAALAARAGSMVSAEELATDVWGDPLPRKWREMLPPLMRRLRVALGAEQPRITTCSPGYRLDVSPEDVDMLAFEALCKDGHAAAQSLDWERAGKTFAKAEALWRGEPFADIPSAALRDRHLQSYALERQLASARETRIEASVRLSARSARAVLPELTALARQHPTNEHTCWLLMLALYRAGRMDEALTAFRETRRHITGMLGVEPGAQLRALNQLILAGDEALLCEPFRLPRGHLSPGPSESGRAISAQSSRNAACSPYRKGETRVSRRGSMYTFRRRLAWLAAAAALVTVTGMAVPAAEAASVATTAAAGQAVPASHTLPASADLPSGLAPADLQQAYDLQSSTSGSGQTVAVITAGSNPEAAGDLALYRSTYGLPSCTTADGCFREVNQSGGSSLPPVYSGWSTAVAETTDTISAICPNCHILVVDASNGDITDLGAAENEAVALGAKFVVNDWSTNETSADTTYDSEYFNHPGVAITAPGDDRGYTGSVPYPAASPYVIAVGGTTLTADSSVTRGFTETTWEDSSSGCSEYEPKPSWQTDTDCGTRDLNDLAADAGTPVAFYDSSEAPGWYGGEGTLVAASIIAASYALAGTPAADSYPAEYPYEHPGGPYAIPGNAYTSVDGLNDITSGSNATSYAPCQISYLCNAGPGYDGPTGLGSPNGTVSLTAAGGQTGVFYSLLAKMCLDDHGGLTTVGNPIDGYTCNGTTSQQFTAEPDGTIQYQTASGDCLDAPGTATGTPVQLAPCDAADGGMDWVPLSSGWIYNPASGLCLYDAGTTPGTQLKLSACGQSRTVGWTVPYTRPATTGPVTARFTSGKCAADDNTTANGSAVLIWTCETSGSGAANEDWDIRPDGFIQIHGSASCLGGSADGTANATPITLYTCNGDPSEHWTERSDGTLIGTLSQRCLTDPGGSTTNGTQLELYDCTSSTGNTWKLP